MVALKITSVTCWSFSHKATLSAMSIGASALLAPASSCVSVPPSSDLALAQRSEHGHKFQCMPKLAALLQAMPSAACEVGLDWPESLLFGSDPLRSHLLHHPETSISPIQGGMSPRLQILHCSCTALPGKHCTGTAMILFMWQDDRIGVARFIDACLQLVHTSMCTGPTIGGQASDQP